MPVMLDVCESGDPVVMVGGVNSQDGMAKTLTALIASLTGGKARIRLFQNDVVPALDSKLADFVVANFDGYADKDVTPGPVGINPTGWAQTDLPTGHFEMLVTEVVANLIYGFLLCDSGAGADSLLKAVRFPQAFPITHVGDFIDVSSFLGIKDSSQA